MKITILGKCISKDNQSRAIGRNRRYFTRPEYRAFENMVKNQARFQWKRPPLEGVLWVNIDFIFENKVRGDLFNLPKSLCDSLNGIVWKDDKQIHGGTLTITFDKMNPRSVIEVLEWDEVNKKWQ